MRYAIISDITPNHGTIEMIGDAEDVLDYDTEVGIADNHQLVAIGEGAVGDVGDRVRLSTVTEVTISDLV